ncbi:MAG: hypothetical protein J6W16_04280 [Methanobrevibacter sp.]|nr:hypothetical protein [Methanobrevibacter sp.]
MVLDEDLCPLHGLTKKGEEQYHQYLESIADEILFKHQHPFKWIIEKMKEYFKYEK